MKNLFTAVATMIVTRFVMKVVDRIKNPPVPSREELHEEVLRKKRAYEERRRAQPKIDVRLASTPRSPDAWLANIATVSELADRYKEFSAQLKENIPEPKEPCDGAALRPRADMGISKWGGNCNGSAMGVAR